jgi:hypothetical protein
MGAVGRGDLTRWLLPVLRDISGDLRQAVAGIEKANLERSYSGIRHEFDLGLTWDDNRQRLAALEGQGDLYDVIHDAYASIARLHRIASSTALRPTQSHDLLGALETIRTAEIAVERSLQTLGEGRGLPPGTGSWVHRRCTDRPISRVARPRSCHRRQRTAPHPSRPTPALRRPAKSAHPLRQATRPTSTPEDPRQLKRSVAPDQALTRQLKRSVSPRVRLARARGAKLSEKVPTIVKSHMS